MMKFIKILSRNSFITILIGTIIITGSGCRAQYRDLNGNGKMDIYENPGLPVTERVDDLISRMTLQEKVGEMFHPRLYVPEDGKFDSTLVRKWIGELHITHFLNNGDAPVEKFAKWSNDVQEFAEGMRLGIPIIFSSDPRWKWIDAPGFAATWNPELIEEYGRARAKEYRAVGLNEALHPMADVATEPRWTRVNGTFGESAYLVSRMVESYILGFQGEELTGNSVICMTKHFPGGGPEKDGLDAHSPMGQEMIYPGDNFTYHLYPWRRAIKVKTGAIMPYYSIPVGYDSVGNNFSKFIITDVLRNKLGYEGIICTDWSAVDERPWGLTKIIGGRLIHEDWSGKIVSSDLTERQILEKSYQLSLDAGVDQFGTWSWDNEIENVLNLVRYGVISEKYIDRALRRILRKKYELGLFENPYTDPERAKDIVGCNEHKKLKNMIEHQSIVLLKNNGLLPLNRKSNLKIFLSGIKTEAFSKFAEVVEDPESADVALMKLESPLYPLVTQIPQKQLIIPDSIQNEIKTILNRGIPTILDLRLRNPLIIPEDIKEKSSCILAEWGVSPYVLADILFGVDNPSGKLPYEIPSSIEAVRGQLEDVPFDSENPAFPFGYGLSYADFEYKNLKISPEKSSEEFNISFYLKNTGKIKADEIVQIYIEEPEGEPRRYLRGFKRVGLKPGETKRVTIKLNSEDIGSYDEEINFRVKPGVKRILVGSSIHDIKLKGSIEIIK